MGEYLSKVFRWQDFKSVYQCRLIGILLWQDQASSGLLRGAGDGQNAAPRPELAGQGQFPDHFVLAEMDRRDLAGSGQDADGNGEVEAAAVLGQVSRRQIDSDPPQGVFEMSVEDGATNPVFAFLDGGFRHTDDGQARQTSRQMDFNRYQGGVDA